MGRRGRNRHKNKGKKTTGQSESEEQREGQCHHVHDAVKFTNLNDVIPHADLSCCQGCQDFLLDGPKNISSELIKPKESKECHDISQDPNNVNSNSSEVLNEQESQTTLDSSKNEISEMVDTVQTDAIESEQNLDDKPMEKSVTSEVDENGNKPLKVELEQECGNIPQDPNNVNSSAVLNEQESQTTLDSPQNQIPEIVDTIQVDAVESEQNSDDKPMEKSVASEVDESGNKPLKVELKQETVECSNDQSCPTINDAEQESALCVCLRCGYIGCSRQSSHKHALEHYNAKNSHPVVVNLSNWIIWCYQCDNEVDPDINQETIRCLALLKKALNVKASKHDNHESRKKKGVHSNNNGMQGATTIKGLTNLGNTCFFNSVMQNLCQTRLLRLAMDHLLLGDFEYSVQPRKEDKELEPLAVVVPDKQGPLTLSLAKFLQDMTEDSKKRAINPGNLFSEICKKAPRFKGFRQQDSQELLRYLLDSVRTEEIKGVKRGILRSFGVNDGANKDGITADEVDSDMHEKIRLYGRRAGAPVIDSLFGGQLVSCVECLSCYEVSNIMESFFDLSLSLATNNSTSKNTACPKKKEPPPRFSGKSTKTKDVVQPKPSANHVISKHQQKKKAKEAKKERKKGKRHNSTGSKNNRKQSEVEENQGAEPNDSESEGNTKESAVVVGNESDNNCSDKEDCATTEEQDTYSKSQDDNEIPDCSVKERDGSKEANEIANPAVASVAEKAAVDIQNPGKKEDKQELRDEIQEERLQNMLSSDQNNKYSTESNEEMGSKDCYDQNEKIDTNDGEVFPSNLDEFSNPCVKSENDGSDQNNKNGAMTATNKEDEQLENKSKAINGKAGTANEEVDTGDPNEPTENGSGGNNGTSKQVSGSTNEIRCANNAGNCERAIITLQTQETGDIHGDKHNGTATQCSEVLTNCNETDSDINRNNNGTDVHPTVNGYENKVDCLPSEYVPVGENCTIPRAEAPCSELDPSNHDQANSDGTAGICAEPAPTGNCDSSSHSKASATAAEESELDSGKQVEQTSFSSNGDVDQTENGQDDCSNDPIELENQNDCRGLQGDKTETTERGQEPSGDSTGAEGTEKEDIKTTGRTSGISEILSWNHSLSALQSVNLDTTSVEGCLRTFCSPEILDGDNKFICDECNRRERSSDDEDRKTERDKKDEENGDDKNDGDKNDGDENGAENGNVRNDADSSSGDKTEVKRELVYTRAVKQLLIYQPPPILTLHLKRFQQVGFSLKKVAKHVGFPLTLDLAPFCHKSSKVATDSEGRVLYSLRGVVEHSGSLHSGHYTAYCRLTKPSDSFFPTSFENLTELLEAMQRMWTKSGDVDGDYRHQQPSEARWFHISDTHVSEVSQQQVLKANAYLLFYERMMLIRIADLE